MLFEKLKLPFSVVEIEKMDFGKAEVSNKIYSENSYCSGAESLLDDFLDKNYKNNSATFYRNFDKCQNLMKKQKTGLIFVAFAVCQWITDSLNRFAKLSIYF